MIDSSTTIENEGKISEKKMHSVNSGLDFAFRFSSVEINLSKKFKRKEFYED